MVDPATMLVTPWPPPVMVSDAPLPTLSPICKNPELLRAFTLSESPVEYRTTWPPEALVRVPVTLTVLVPPEKPVGVIMLAVLHFVSLEDDAPALVHAGRTRTWREFDERADNVGRWRIEVIGNSAELERHLAQEGQHALSGTA